MARPHWKTKSLSYILFKQIYNHIHKCNRYNFLREVKGIPGHSTGIPTSKSELLKNEKAEMYRELIENNWRTVRMQAVQNVEDECKSFKSTNLRISEDVYGLKTVGG